MQHSQYITITFNYVLYYWTYVQFIVQRNLFSLLERLTCDSVRTLTYSLIIIQSVFILMKESKWADRDMWSPKVKYMFCCEEYTVWHEHLSFFPSITLRPCIEIITWKYSRKRVTILNIMFYNNSYFPLHKSLWL